MTIGEMLEMALKTEPAKITAETKKRRTYKSKM